MKRGRNPALLLELVTCGPEHDQAGHQLLQEVMEREQVIDELLVDHLRRSREQ